MKRLFFSILLAASLSLPSLAQWNTQNILKMGRSALFLDDYVSAIKNFNKIIALKPYLSEPYFFRGLAKLNLDDYDGAIRDFTTAIKQDPNYLYAYVYRGMAYNGFRRYDEALKDYEKAIQLDPSSAFVYANKGVTLSELGKFKESEENYSKAIRLDKTLVMAYLNRALVREKLNDVLGALSDCNSALSNNIFSVDAYNLRGYINYKQKKFHDAIEDFNNALKISPKNIKLFMNRAMVWYDLKKYDEVIKDYENVIRLDSTYIYAYYNRSQIYSEQKKYDLALKDLNTIIKMNPENILIYFNRGMIKEELKDYIGAYNDFSESIKLYPDFVKAYLARASVSSKLEKDSLARRDNFIAMDIMDRYKRMKGGDITAFVDTTENFTRLIDISSKSDRVRNVVNGRIQDKDVMVRLKGIFAIRYLSLDSLRNGKTNYYEKNIMNYNQEHNYNPAFIISNKNLQYSSMYIDSLYKRQELINPQTSEALFIKGIINMDNGEYLKAIKNFSAIKPDSECYLFALFNLANTRMMMYNYISSIDDMKIGEAIGEQRNSREKINYSLVYNDYKKCLEIDSDFIYAIFNEANAHAKNIEIDKAISLYSQVISKDPNFAEAYFNRGLLYIYINDKAKANVDLSKAGELGIVESYSIIKHYCSDI